MVTLKFLRENLTLVAENCLKRGFSFDKEVFLANEEERLALLRLNEEKKRLLNRSAREVGVLKETGKAVDANVYRSMKVLGEEIKRNDEKIKSIEEKVTEVLLSLPNLIDASVPEGLTEEDNLEVRKWGDLPSFDFPVLSHDVILEKNSWVDFKKAAMIARKRFVILRGEILKLKRALISFFIAENLKKGYLEVEPPSIVNRKALQGTGQLPKFSEDLFFLGSGFENFALIPTAEVPLTNFHQNTILLEKDLPINLTAHTPCFRSEAGSAGKDLKGLIRLHEFSKVELVKIVHPDRSPLEHEEMVQHVESLLQKLNLPYRVMLLSAGDTGFSAEKCYDLEVWLPSQERYREISSCSNCSDFQASRMKTRFRKSDQSIGYVHTLNGSALPIGRTLVAILENHQKADGTIEIPKVLEPYCL